MNKKKKLYLNTISSLGLELTTVVCGFILPRLILSQYGSEVNGLIHSITQFLSIISFLELGIGAVIQSSLYRPLAEKDSRKISEIMVSGQKFFSRIARILLVYVGVLIIVFPIIIKNDFGWAYTAFLIVALSISSLSQYYFGIIDRLLLSADQCGYIQYIAQIITLILNTIGCAVLIKAGASIQIVKLMTAGIYLLRPLALRFYVNRHYTIDRGIKYEGEPIKQKWNGIAQHVSTVILNNTDTIVLTVFSSLENVSIYSVYYMVVNGIEKLIVALLSGLRSLLGNLWVKGDTKKLLEFYNAMVSTIHFGSVFAFGCTGVLLLPFIRVYTSGITDTNYMQPVFGILLVAALGVYCLRLPYNMLILAAGHYKQTQRCHIIGAAINVVVSIATVYFFGLVGVACGTFAAMAYQTCWMAYYCSKHLIDTPVKAFWKQIAIDIIAIALIVICTVPISMQNVSYISWVIMALKVAPIVFVVVFFFFFFFYKKELLYLKNNILKRK